MQVIVLLVACTVGIGLPYFAYGVPEEIYEDGDHVLDESEAGYSDVISSTPKRVTSTEDDPELQDSALVCGRPREVDKASVSGSTRNVYSVGSTVEYVCDFGFVADGIGKSSRCVLEEGDDQPEWTVPQITCVPRSCGDPGYVTHARRVGSLFTFPNRVNFECEEGYQLRGSSSRYCQTNGKWSGRLPTCTLVSCDTPQDIENGRATYSSLEYGSELEYECDKGYKLSTRQIRVCSANGEWTGDEPSCTEAECEHPVAPENGKLSIIGDKITAGSLATYSCNNGLVLRGSNVTKCLETGEWTFPTPECLEPCIIPQVWNGQIGTYQSSYGRRERRFRQIPVGTLLKDEENMFLLCSSGYRPVGIADFQTRVSCDRGRWSRILGCESASCTQEPPETINGHVSYVKRDHRGTVEYTCKTGFTKTQYGNITCVYGEWKGRTPICTSKPCSVNSLEFPGLVRPRKVTYTNGESFEPSCSKGYTVARPQNSILICKHGSWDGHLPPCMGEGCLNPPPAPPHGRVNSYGRLHTAIANYECDEYFILREDSKVTCLFGEWKGKLPSCIDSRCYAKDFGQRKGLALQDIPVTYSGHQMDVICYAGYHVGSRKPVCMDGKWTDTSFFPCSEDLCAVPPINNGGITVKTFIRGRYIWQKLTHEQIPVYNKVRINIIPDRGTELYISCEERYSVQGKGGNHVPVFCEEGRWRPNPVCQITGTPYQEVSIAREGARMTTRNVLHQKTDSTTTEATRSAIFTTAKGPRTSSIHDQAEISEQDNCYCVFPVEDKVLQAYVGNEKIGFRSEVLKGNIVKFHCSDVGSNRLVGNSELKCDDCRNWHSSEVPSCVATKRGDGVIFFDPTFNVSNDGVLEIEKGQKGRLICVSNEVSYFPIWHKPARSNVSIDSEREVLNVGTFYVSRVNIVDANLEHEGKYACYGSNSEANTVELRVIDPGLQRILCPAFETDSELKVEYNVNSEVTASFSCKRANQKLEGRRTLICLANGSWSGEPPECNEFMCPEIESSENMKISYSDGFKVGSIAAFHCFSPNVRIGVSNTRCLENGHWKDQPAICSLSRCHLQALYSIMPAGLRASMEGVNNDTVPYGTSLHLMCEEGLAIDGDSEAKCGNEGQWEVPTPQCVPGCPAFKKPTDSRLIIEPEKDVYRFGDFVIFSCPGGLSLTSENEKIACLRNGWSERTIPDCTN